MRGKANEDADDPRAKRREWERQYRERNRERLRENQARWRAANPDKVLAKQRKYENTEKGKATWSRYAESEKRKHWSQQYRASANENNRRWYYGNLDHARALKRINSIRRTERMAQAPGRATTEQLLQRAAYWGFRCWVCRGEWSGTMDHVIPVALGGSNWPANRRPVCKSCNEKKGSKHPLHG